MKRLITILLSFIGCVGLFGQNNAPMLVAGKMYVSGPVWSVGAVHVDVSLDTGKIDIGIPTGSVGSPRSILKTDTIIFYSNNTHDGLLRNLSADSGVVGINHTPTVILRKKVEEVWTYFSLPFRANTQIYKNGSPLNSNQYGVYTFDAEKRALQSNIAPSVTWKPVPYADQSAKQSAAGYGYEKAIGYQIYVLGGGEIDFVSAVPKDIDTLFSNQLDKHIHYTMYGAPTGVWEDATMGDGWAFIGGLHSSSYRLDQTTFEHEGNTLPAVHVRRGADSREGTGVWDSKPIFGGESVVVGPYTSFFVQGESTPGTSVLKRWTHKAGKDGLLLESAKYRSANADNSPVKDQLYFALTSDKGSFDRFYLNFADTYVDAYKAMEDAIKMSTVYPDKPAVWALFKGKQALLVDGLPIKNNTEVQMGFSADAAGNYTISLDPQRQQDVRNVILLDKITGKKVNLLESDYSFNTGAVNNENNRFILYINSSYTDIPSINSDNNPYAYIKDNILTVKNLTEGDRVQILDLAGRTIVSGKVSGKEFSTALSQKGVYVVNVTGGKTSVLKVLNK